MALAGLNSNPYQVDVGSVDADFGAKIAGAYRQGQEMKEASEAKDRLEQIDQEQALKAVLIEDEFAASSAPGSDTKKSGAKELLQQDVITPGGDANMMFKAWDFLQRLS